MELEYKDIDLSTLLGKRIAISQASLPFTPASRALDIQERIKMRRSVVDYTQKQRQYTMNRANRVSPGSTVGNSDEGNGQVVDEKKPA